MFYTVPSATEALIITGGLKRRKPGNPFRIVVGSGAFWLPLVHKVHHFYIGAHNVQVQLTAQTEQNITIDVEANVVFRVAANTERGIQEAASRFLDNSREEMEDIAREIFSGETRSLIGQRSVESIINNRMALAADVVANTEPKMLELGWQVDSFQISSITDRNGHIDNLSKPELVRVERAAAIAQAKAGAEVEKEQQEAERSKSLYRKETDLQVSENTIETAQARARAEQSGPRAEAEAKIEVAETETKLASAEATRRAAQLEEEIIKPAEADAQAKKIAAEAEAEVIRAIAAAINDHDGAYLDKEMLDHLPKIVENLSKGISDSNLTILGDSDDATNFMAKIATVAYNLRDTLKDESKPADKQLPQ